MPVPASGRRKVSAVDITPSPSRSTSNVSRSVPSSALLGMPSGPVINVWVTPGGRSRSPRRSKHAIPPSTSLEFAVTHRWRWAKEPGMLCSPLPVLNVKLDPACKGVRLPTRTDPPAGTDPTVTRGKVMQSTFGSDDDRMKLAPVRAAPLFWILTLTSPVSPGSGKGSWSPSMSW